ncbi:MAG TPA: peroxidase family protein [Candidatus Limnocylindria bacterium]|nr:peroxidase family protein [Candidatus Limnocylindria bacterium]
MRDRKRSGVLAIVVTMTALAVMASPGEAATFANRTLDGTGNNLGHPGWGRAGSLYLRVAPTNYLDGISRAATGPSIRFVSNRVFNDVGQNIFSENGVTQWGWLWGQFLDHDFGLRDERPAEASPIGFDPADPLEAFTNDLGAIGFSRTPAAPGTGVTTPRQQINTITSFIDASNVYGVDSKRLEWLRVGPVDGDLSNNGARLLLTADGYLPRIGARGDPATAPAMDLMGPLVGTPNRARVAGDVRANENIALTALHTLFAREHNRIVASLPVWLSAEDRFQIARRVVGAEIEYITYTQFLPALGVRLEPYRGYDPTRNPGLSNEFAVVGYRAHSMIHGEFDTTVRATRYTEAELAAFAARGIGIERNGDQITLTIPLASAFGSPDLLEQLGLGPVFRSLSERQYKNDEQIDNALRSVLFQIPKPGIADPAICGAPVVNPDCFSGVSDLGAIDIARGRDHGMPTYNDLRRAYGLAPKTSFVDITGEATQRFPVDPLINASDAINDPNILDFIELRDANGNVVAPDSEQAQEDVVIATRRTTLAARLKAIYGSVDRLDAFVGMVSERHVNGTEFGELQLAMWKKQFEAVRDGDRFFYLNDPVLRVTDAVFGINPRHTLAEIVKLNTGVTLQSNVFKFAG